MLINKKLQNYRLQLSQNKIANFSISKSTKLPNFYHGQTEQFAFGQYSEWQFVEVKLGTPGPWEKSKCKLLVQKLAISKGLTKGHNVSNLEYHFTPATYVVPSVLPC